MAIRVCLMLLLALTRVFSLCAQDADYDIVVFKDGVEPPEFAKEKQLKCRVLDNQNTNEVTVDISLYQGIQTIRKIDRSLIADITLIDQAKVSYHKIKDRIALPANSASVEYYDRIIHDVIQPLLKQYPDHEIARTLTVTARELEREKKLVQLGWVRRNEVWYSPDENKTYAGQQELAQFLVELREIQSEVLQGSTKPLIGLADRLNRFKNNLYYPYLLEGVQVIARPAKLTMPPDLSLLTKQNGQRLLELSNQFQKASARFEEIREQQLCGLELFVPLLDAWITVSKGWPELEGLREQVDLGLEAVLNNLWLSALQGEKMDGVYNRVTGQLRLLSETGTLTVAKGQLIRSEMESITSFKNQLFQFRSQEMFGKIAELNPPERVSSFAPALELFHSLIDEAKTKMANSDQLLVASQLAYQSQDWNQAMEQIAEARKLWPHNPKIQVFYNQLVGDFSN
ncbi:MAG: hypothetical protein LBD30_01980, partial [Verrucomicrobiales bacterium]|nr:hypothetical protein [Verrucomicrobiales bacterium]